VFVLLHLEDARCREDAIKELLTRSAANITDESLAFLVETLQIPFEWISEAKASLARYNGNSFEAYECYLEAGRPKLAQNIAMEDLVQGAIVRNDLNLLRSLFSVFDPRDVEDWSFRGKLYLDYADCISKIPGLLESVHSAVADAAEELELERLSRAVPQLIQLLPDVLPDRKNLYHNICLGVMLKALMALTIPLGLTNAPKVQEGLVAEEARLKHIQSTAYNRFLIAVDAAA